MDFKFGRYIHNMVHPNPIKSSLKILEKREHGHIQDCPNFWVPYNLRVKLRTSNFVRTFIGSIGTKAHENFGKIAVG